ncbi:MAG TPA: type IX secretion system membrane protein PorP/SprF, partial [Bacteroidetes bacterium]|nr:type IX secretion system membrane protein PorP/SprF [Bacteroidota bacterium]
MNRMIKKISGILFFILVVIAGIQGQYSQYMVNGLVINPAYAGSRGVFSLSGCYKQVWTALPGSPIYQQIGAHMPLKNDRVGLGMVLGSNKEGAYQTMYGSFDYAYRIHFENSVLSMGIRATAECKKENFDGLKYDPSDPVFVNNSVFRQNFGFGVYYYNSRLFAGLSVPGMITYGMTDTSFTEKLTSFNPVDYHYLATVGVLVGKGKFKWKPTVLFQYLGLQNDYG